MILNALKEFLIPSFIRKRIRINTYFDSLDKNDVLSRLEEITFYRIETFILKKVIIYAYNIGMSDSDLLSITPEIFRFSYGRAIVFESLIYRKIQCFMTGVKFIY